MDEVQGLELLHDDLTGQLDWQGGVRPTPVSPGNDDGPPTAPTNGANDDALTADLVQSNSSVKRSSQIVGMPIHTTGIVTNDSSSNDAAADTGDTGTTTTASTPPDDATHAPDATADAVWVSMLVHASLTVDQLALSAASRLGLKPALLARLTRATAPSQTTQSNRTAPSQTTQLTRPSPANHGGPSSHNSTNTTTTNQQPNMFSSSVPTSSAMSNPVKSSSQINANPVKSSSQMCLDTLGQAVVVRPEGTIDVVVI